jgi:isocitrate/isopropylmalate dehydrogenase
MLDHLGEPEAAAELEAAVDAVLAAGGQPTTQAWADALTERLAVTGVGR